MKQFLTNIKKLLLPRRIFVPVILIITGFALFLVVYPSQAGFGASLAEWLIIPIAGFFGNMTVTLIGILISVAQYNNFIEATAVVKGWVMVRDVVNMFFIIMILLIAFGTVFRWENYHYKKMLGKLLIAAVLVNFSRGIVGFMIDFAQVIMLTFVYAFKDAAAGNFVQGFHLDKMFQFAQNTLSPEEARTLEADDSTFLVASLLALISIFITMVVVAVFLIVLIIRIVVLWFLVITSPIAFSLNIFPGDLKKYADQWWNYFGKYVTTGPILAFFLWLSLYVMQITGGNQELVQKKIEDSSGGLTDVPGAAITGIGSSEILLSFIVNIGLLVGALIMTQQAGVVGGKLAGAAVDYMRKAGGAIVKAPFKFASKQAWTASKLAGRKLDVAQMGLQKSLGIKSPRSLNYRLIKEGYKKSRDQAMKEYEEFGGKSGDWQETFNKYTDYKRYLGKDKSEDRLNQDSKKAETLNKEAEAIRTKANNTITDSELLTSINNTHSLEAKETELQTAISSTPATGTIGVDKNSAHGEAKNVLLDIVASLKTSATKALNDGKRSEAQDYEAQATTLQNTINNPDPLVRIKIDSEIGKLYLDGLAQKQRRIQNDIASERKKQSDSSGNVVYTEEEKNQTKSRLTLEAQEKEQEAAKLLRHRVGVQTSAGTAYGEMARETGRHHAQQEIMQTTGGETGAVKNELYKNILASKYNEVIACLNILAENGDLNEQFKNDPRFSSMIKEALRSNKISGVDLKGHGAEIAASFDKNPVSPGNMAAWLQYVFEDKLHLNKEESARLGAKLGNISVATGSGQYFGMAAADERTGGFHWLSPEAKQVDGQWRLQASADQMAAAAAKMANIGGQMRSMRFHFGNFVTERSDGNPGYLSEIGKSNLDKLTSVDLTNMNRYRPDFIIKVGAPQIVQEIYNYADEVAQGRHDTRGVSPAQARIIRDWATKLAGSRAGNI